MTERTIGKMIVHMTRSTIMTRGTVIGGPEVGTDVDV